MKIFRSKKAFEMITLTVIVIIILAFLIGSIIDITPKECRTNTDCGSDFYCGSDFACHQIPVIEKTVVENNFLVPSIITGIAIIIAAFVLKSDKIRFRKRAPKEISHEEIHNNSLRTP